MLEIATEAAKKRFHHCLKAAEISPVIITRHGTARAVLISAPHLKALLRAADEAREKGAVAELQRAMEEAHAGRLGRAARHRNRARLLAGLSGGR